MIFVRYPNWYPRTVPNVSPYLAMSRATTREVSFFASKQVDAQPPPCPHTKRDQAGNVLRFSGYSQSPKDGHSRSRVVGGRRRSNGRWRQDRRAGKAIHAVVLCVAAEGRSSFLSPLASGPDPGCYVVPQVAVEWASDLEDKNNI